MAEETEKPASPSGIPFPDVMANLRAQETNLTLLYTEVLDLLRLCKERHQLGPILNLPGEASTTIENTLWIPWVSGSPWYLYGLLEGGPDFGSAGAKITTHG